MKLTENAKFTLTKRILAKSTETGEVIEAPEEMIRRVADAVAEAEKRYEDGYQNYAAYRVKFYDMIDNLDFLPNSPTLVNAGRPLGQLSACFVLPVDDDMRSIFDAVGNTALIHQTGGGTGFSFSRLRSKDSLVSSTGGTASGPVSFMQVFNQATEVIKQGGCFTGDTLIATDRGPVPICQLRAGMQVLTKMQDGTLGYVPCTDPFLTRRDVDIREVSFTGGLAVRCTPDHPFMTDIDYNASEYRYKKAIELVKGDRIIGAIRRTSTDLRCEFITVETVTHYGYADVWNVEVPVTHNYCVCQETGKDSYVGVFVSNTRRGANMGILRVDHPDIMDFITCKNDLTSLNNFNLSVAITDEFMNALAKDDSYNLVDPHTKAIVKTVRAKEVWDMIVESAWNTGEPGIVFIDRVNKFNTLKNVIGEIESTNPCVAGWTRITTDKGEVEIRDVVDQEVNVWNGEVFSTVTPRVTGTNQECLIIGLAGYDPIFCTPYHKFITATGARVEAKDLNVGDVLAAWTTPQGTVENTMVSYISNGPILDKVYCFTEPLRHAGMFNGVITGNCGEQPLLPYESCNLGSINLTKFVYRLHKDDKPNFDFDRLREITKLATRFLDDVIDVNKYPLSEIEVRTLGSRKIGLGVMGFADTLLMMGIPYNSNEALDLGYNIMNTIQRTSHSASMELALERGPYPYYVKVDDGHTGIDKRRNNTTTTIAPTGTLSIIAGVSSGIEPVFAYAFYRKVLDDDKLPEVNPILMKELHKRHLDTPEIIDEIITKGSLAHVDGIPEDMKRVFVCSHDITPNWHVKMQAMFQQCVDNAVSKTVNFTHDATREDIDKTYRFAYQLGCKGITVYRDGSRSGQTLNIGKVDEKKPAETEVAVTTDLAPVRSMPRERGELLQGFTRKVRIGCGKLYVTVNHDENGICEVFTTNGKAGGCPSQSEAVARISSLALRSGVPIDEIINQLSGIRCQSCIHREGVNVLSCPDAIAKQLQLAKGLIEGDSEDKPEKVDTITSVGSSAPADEIPLTKDMAVCPNCGVPLEHEGGCVICRSCGASKCG